MTFSVFLYLTSSDIMSTITRDISCTLMRFHLIAPFWERPCIRTTKPYLPHSNCTHLPHLVTKQGHFGNASPKPMTNDDRKTCGRFLLIFHRVDGGKLPYMEHDFFRYHKIWRWWTLWRYHTDRAWQQFQKVLTEVVRPVVYYESIIAVSSELFFFFFLSRFSATHLHLWKVNKGLKYWFR